MSSNRRKVKSKILRVINEDDSIINKWLNKNNNIKILSSFMYDKYYVCFIYIKDYYKEEKI